MPTTPTTATQERTAERRPTAWRWRLLRACYYGVLAALFGAVALYVGPNLILFGKPTRLSPADFAATAEQRCVPVVRAMKAYRRDHGGRLPARVEELVPQYLPAADAAGPSMVSAEGYSYWASYNHVITYSFTPGDEGWRVEGPFTSGSVPLPPVTAGPPGPSTHPADTRPD